MLASELKIGDLIFTHLEFGVYTHVAMYTGYGVDGKQQITHSVTNDWPGIQSTVLVDQSPMYVFRPVSSDLGEKAANRMLDWVQYHIPYDSRRAKWMNTINKTVKPALLLSYLQQEAKTKFYERIKFTARRDTCPIKIMANKESRGFTCVQAAILAYQTAELEPYVKTLSEVREDLQDLATTEEELNEIWISDKHCPENIMDTYKLPESYIKYFMALRDKEEFTDFCINDKRDTPSHPHYYPSLVAWRSDNKPIDDFISEFNSCFELPAKICFTKAMFEYMQQRPDAWVDLGKIEKKSLRSKTSFTAQEKKLHRAHSSDLSESIEINRLNIIFERSISITSSPRTSPSNSFYESKKHYSNPDFPIISDNDLTSPLLGTLYPRLSST